MRLTKTALFLFFALLVSGSIFAQESTEPAKANFKTRYGQPDIPGTFVMDFGFVQPIYYRDTLSVKFWASKSVSFYYYYDFQIGKSGFSFSPGIGVGLDRMGFKNPVTLNMPTGDTVQVVHVPTVQPTWDVNKTKLITNYFEIPLELRWHSNPNSFRRSFYIGVGGKFGVLMDHSTKLKYNDDGTKVKTQDKRDISLNRWRYGLLARMGYKGLSVFYYHNFSTLFKKNKGPLLSDPSTISFGITVRGF